MSRLEAISFLLSRHLRNARDLSAYPFWSLRGRPAPDNHVFKKSRIKRIADDYSCDTLVETGTFYGQTSAAMHSTFAHVFTCELSTQLFDLNRRSFMHIPNLHVLQGDSAVLLKEILPQAPGRILFWLDGHYSGPGTAIGDTVSPVLGELNAIRRHERKDHCILVDDARLFTGSEGYPSMEELRGRLLLVNPNFRIWQDFACVVAVPQTRENNNTR